MTLSAYGVFFIFLAFVEVLNVHKLQKDWNVFPNSFTTQLLGDDFINRNEACVLKVPSAVVKGDFNFLINHFLKI